MSSSSATYVQGVFTSIESPKYFGFSLGKKGDWIVYDGSPEKSFVLDNFIELKNGVLQKIYLKPNYQDTDYLGPGKYFVKLKRYTASGSPSDYSNSIEIDLSYKNPTPISSQTPNPTQTITPSIATTPIITAQVVNHQVTPKVSQSQSLAPVVTGDFKGPTPQVLASTSSTFNDSLDLITTPTQTIIKTNSTPESTTSTSFQIISDKNLFLIGVSIFSISSLLLYFRIKNL